MNSEKNRWLIALSAVAIHLSIGSVYAYSAWKMPLENSFGWTSAQTSLSFSLAIGFLGLSAAFLGKLIERRGPRVGALLSAILFPSGLLLAGLACRLESLWLFHMGFGVVGGIGLGLGYLAPVSTLVRWFPDRRGLATGLAIMGFGFGGLVCARLIDVFVPPEGEVVVPMEATHQDVRSAVEIMPPGAAEPAGEGMKTVVLYNHAAISRGFLLLGGLYFLVMVSGALYLAPPPEGYADRFDAPGKRSMAPPGDSTVAEALRSPAYYALWLMLFLNVACGIALIATAKKLGYEMVHLTVERAGVLVMGISLFNGLGRIAWAALSDRIGRPNTFVAFFALQLVAFPLLPHLAARPWAFMAATFLILTCYGGGFSCAPAYLSDLFGLKSMPTLYGILLTAWSAAGFAGPMLNAWLYGRTGSYLPGLRLSAWVFAVALAIAVWMRLATGRRAAD